MYIYRDEHGKATGSCVVGMVSVEEALRVEAALDGKSIEGGAGWFTLRVRVVPRRLLSKVSCVVPLYSTHIRALTDSFVQLHTTIRALTLQNFCLLCRRRAKPAPLPPGWQVILIFFIYVFSRIRLRLCFLYFFW